MFKYATNYLYEFDNKIFNRIDLLDKIIGVLNIESRYCEKQIEFFEYLEDNIETFNLSEN